MRALVSSVALVFALAACSDDGPTVPGADASTTRPDATTVRMDATANTDTGVVVVADSGVTETDSGATETDTGVTETDTGVVVVDDSGVVETDTGVVVVDDSGVADPDGGVVETDSGVVADPDGGVITPADFGVLVPDSGVVPPADSGVVVTPDSGVVVVPDSGVVTPADGGVVVADTGVVGPADTGVDAGTAPGDAGTNPGTYVESVLAAPAWVDVCATPANVLTLTDDDDGHGPATTIPFAFSFFGAPRSAVWASTNGFLTFDVTPRDSYQPAIPDTAEGPAVYAYWQDLALFDTTAAVCIGTTGTAPNRRMVIQWNNMQSLEAFDFTEFTFQAQLHEGTGIIDLIYNTMSVTDPGDATLANGTLLTVIGLQTAAGAQTVVHSGAINTTTGIRFTP